MKNTKTSFLSEILTTMGSALAAAAAVRQRIEPDVNTLHALGIDPVEFRKIKRY